MDIERQAENVEQGSEQNKSLERIQDNNFCQQEGKKIWTKSDYCFNTNGNALKIINMLFTSFTIYGFITCRCHLH